MPKKRGRKKSTSTRKKATIPKKKKQDSWEGIELSISPETSAEITAIILVLLGVFSLISLFGLFGSLGQSLQDFLRQVFGWTSYLFAVSLIILGYIMFYPKRYKIPPFSYVGFMMFLLLIPSLVHVFIKMENSFDVALTGGGGGFVGHFISANLKDLVSFSGALLIIITLFIISILLLFNTTIKKMAQKLEEDSYKAGHSVVDSKKVGKIKINLPQKENIISKKIRKSDKTRGVDSVEEEGEKEEPKKKTSELESNIERISFDWEFPPLNLLDDSRYSVDSGNITGNAEIIAKTLSQFGIQVAMQDVNVGPTFTQYTLKPHEGTKLSKITSLQDDLALALATHPIRIEAPIPGKSLVGVEIPNKKVALVRLKEVLESNEYKNSVNKGNLIVALGKDVSGVPAVTDVSRMPHLLIAGATGSGKSVCVNGVLASLLYRYSPKELKLILVDPKRVELTGYNDIAHLLTPVIVEPDKTINAFRWAVLEMENRYKILSEEKARDIVSYNKKVSEEERLPYIVMVVDELADVMIQAGNEMEGLIVRIAQMARAVGIHLIIATQRPSVNVVTGLIKANVPTRIAFRVASQIDSRTILDMAGAERLVGQGDMLFMAGDGQKPKRIQGVFVSEKEIKNILDQVKEQGEVEYNEDIVKSHKLPGGVGSAGSAGEVDDDMYQEAYDVVMQSGKASSSLLQRRLKIGYARAARLLDILEDQGIVGPADGAKPREILVSETGGGDEGAEGVYDDDWGEEE